ncbi:MAG: hypothetical protein KC897_06435 [Candidatus Omnitrophica bacterium]|nr:hypothetical protein [Candidatus Omnitrophota bacterium]MCB9719991.1 hypothetical protein [Candidatus Omnitrophota bacterium]
MRLIMCMFLLFTCCPASAAPLNDTADARLMHHFLKGKTLPSPAFPIDDTGDSIFIDYAQYGELTGAGTPGIYYRITDRAGLKKAVGAGIYPNNFGIRKESGYAEYETAGKLDAGHWDVFADEDAQRAFYVWPQAPDATGTKLFFTALILERSGHIKQALKAYYATLLHTPKQYVWSADKSFVWYTAPGAMSSVRRLCDTYPQLECALEGASVSIDYKDDNDPANDVVAVNPGKIVRRTAEERLAALPDMTQQGIAREIVRGDTRLVRYNNGHWRMTVGGEPFFVRGVTYSPTEIGLGPHNDPYFHARWMHKDKNNNGRIDAAYDAWVDQDRNGVQDDDEPAIGDFQLMKDMGVNAIRYYIPTAQDRVSYDPAMVNKPLLRDLYENYGIRVIAGDMLGAYTVGSGADWQTGTDYTDPGQRKVMLEVLRAKVLDLKDEPWVLMWVLGNENNMPLSYSGVNATKTNAGLHPQAWAEFLNEAAELIHELDGKHPVAVGNISTGLADYYQKYAPAIDIMGVNSYQGAGGFGNVWETVQERFDRPVLITEYGCDVWHTARQTVDEGMQRDYHEGNLRDIVLHQAGGPYTGNAIGGVAFQFIDEWWKDTHAGDGSEATHETASTYPFPFPDGFSSEEWLGLVGQGSGDDSPFERRLRKSYFYYKEVWGK